jgi:TPR repeat protein
MKAIGWYSKSAEYNNSDALTRLSDIYKQEKDPITKKDISCDAYIINAKKAMTYAQRANSASRVGDIAYDLGSIFERGSYRYETQKCPKDKVLALKYFEISANNNNREAAKVAADYFYKTRQYKKAFNYYLQLLNGYSISMFTTQERSLEIASIEFKIGFMYENGVGTRKDVANAMAYYTKAANKGLIEAKHNLSVLSKRSGSFSPL